MNESISDVFNCPKCHGKLSISDESQIVCENQKHRFSIEDEIPVFVKREDVDPKDAKIMFEYNEMASKYDEAINYYNTWLGVDLMQEFVDVVGKLPIKGTEYMLDVSIGTGNVNFALKAAFPNTEMKFAGIDLSIGFLKVAQQKFKEAGLKVALAHSQVFELPFADETFDIVTHSGGINTYTDIPGTLKEWIRVLKPGGLLFITDEGVDPAERKTARGKKIMKDNTLFAAHPPLEYLPAELKNIELAWVARGTFYTLFAEKRTKEELAAL